MIHGVPLLSVGPVLTSGHLGRGTRGIGDRRGITLFGVFLAHLAMAATYAPPSILNEASRRKSSSVFKLKVSSLRGTRNPRYFLTRENNIELHFLQLRYWGQAIPDYNNYHTRPLVAPPRQSGASSPVKCLRTGIVGLPMTKCEVIML